MVNVVLIESSSRSIWSISPNQGGRGGLLGNMYGSYSIPLTGHQAHFRLLFWSEGYGGAHFETCREPGNLAEEL